MAESNTGTIIVRVLSAGEQHELDRIAPGVFDNPIDRALAREFLRDARHHLAIARADDMIVGMASALHYVHPDKAPELWINEIGVSPVYRGQGIASRMLEALFERARALGCQHAWVLTDHDNVAAQRLYSGAGGRAAPVVMYSFQLDRGPPERAGSDS
jgi:ribosomal protein S18 acetylase RimI-like enzyme